MSSLLRVVRLGQRSRTTLRYPWERRRRTQYRCLVVPQTVPDDASTTTARLPVRISSTRALLLLALVGTVTTSLATRQWRQRQIDGLEELVVTEAEAVELATTLERAALMGAKSTSEELERIRVWHAQRGYLGGIVLRDVTKLVQAEDTEADPEPPWPDVWKLVLGEERMRQVQRARRECYYVYYEITDAGQHVQQIFVRGTSLWIDVITCLQTIMVYDAELQCRVHLGFRQHAHRILNDILPLLSKDAEVELCGHSLGGAVASLLAMKLTLRGYKVTKLTTIGEPAYLSLWSPGRLQHVPSLLPRNHIRIESDCDLVPYVPPFGCHMGKKLWLTRRPSQQTECRWVPDKCWWTESLFINFCVPEIAAFHRSAHRIPTYRHHLLQQPKVATDPT
jgi:Lipase (class 3)